MKQYTEFILERSSLPYIGVPTEIMQIIQYDFDFSDDIKWFKSDKNEIVQFTFASGRSRYSQLFCGISDKKVFFLFSYNINDNVLYNYDEFIKIEDDFGDGWERFTEVELDFKKILSKIISFNGKIWYSHEDKYNIKPKIERKLKSIQKSFDDITIKFKEKSIDKLKTLGIIISDNVQGANGLTEFEEYLLNFEKEYSEFKNKYITIEYLINKFGIEKTITSFIYFIKKNDIIKYDDL